MSTLYLTEQGAALTRKGRRLVVVRDGEALLEIPEFKVQQVLVFGNVSLTTPALTFLLDHGIDTSFLSLRGKLRGRLVPIEGKNVTLRLTQFERFREAAFRQRLAASIVTAKLRNARTVAQHYERR